MTRKPKTKKEILLPLTSAARMERWHLCQRIAKLYYESPHEWDELIKIKDYLERTDVLK